MRERDRATIVAGGGGVNELQILDALYGQPLVNAAWVEGKLGVVAATANKVLSRLETLGILREVTGQKRNRRFRYDSYLELFDTPQYGIEADATRS